MLPMTVTIPTGNGRCRTREFRTGLILDVELAVVPAHDPIDVHLHANSLAGGKLCRELQVFRLWKILV